MWVIANGTKATEIDDDVITRVLNLYPEEKLIERDIFQEAFSKGEISSKNLREESEKILIPWQMFFLTRSNLNTQIAHIDKQRSYKVSAKLMAKRRGTGEVTSKRIIDRLIRQQNFLLGLGGLVVNPFCASLKGIQTKRAAVEILNYFNIQQSHLWKSNGKGRALEYLIAQVEAKNINISRGVLTHKLLPTWQVVPSDVYRNTSGFVIKDEHVPFLFLPGEINPDEVESRQIYTLIYLLATIGLEQYDYFLDKDFRAKMMKAKGVEARLHAITTELLMPAAETDKLRGVKITPTMRDTLAGQFKVSSLALVITLRMRGVISNAEYNALKPPPFVPHKGTGVPRSPKISTSVGKFCGKISSQAINTAIKNGGLPSIQAQYLIFGAVNKKGYKKYRNELNI